MNKLFTLTLALFLSGCVTSVKIPSLENGSQLKEGNGILLLSTGRNKSACDTCKTNWAGILPFITYQIYASADEDKYRKLATIPAETNGGINQLGPDNYGFIHAVELPEGNYLMEGIHGRNGNGMMIAAPGAFLFIPDFNSETNISYEFSISGGNINYIGEFITTDAIPENSSIYVSNSASRDKDFLYEKYPSLKRLPVLVQQLKKPNKTRNPTP